MLILVGLLYMVFIERGYPNLYTIHLKWINVTADSYFDQYAEDNSKMVPGFTMSMRTRPMAIGKFQEYISDRAVTIRNQNV